MYAPLIVLILIGFLILLFVVYRAGQGAAEPEFGKQDFLEKIPEPPKEPLEYQKAGLFLTYPDLATAENIRAARLGMGANTISLMFDLMASGEEVFLRDEAQQLRTAEAAIREAHRQGLYVELRIGGAPGSNPTNPEAFIENSLDEVRKIAQLAEKYKVARFGIFTELDNNFGLGAFPGHIDRALRIYLEEARKYYSGEIGMGFCCELSGKDYDLSGYDYLVVSINPGRTRPKDDWLRSLEGDLEYVKDWAARYEITDVGIGEVGFINEEDERNSPFRVDFTYLLTPQEEVNMYEEIFERTGKYVSGYTFYYGFPIMSIKGRKAEAFIKSWFDKL